jgi:site-specific DNA-methyltransferase (adenine-specific)
MVEIYEAEREVIGTKTKLESYQYKNNNVYVTNGDKEKVNIDITIPSTDLAKQWQGWGTTLKPSFEPIIVARKPFKGSLVDNVIEYGVGGINIDECRVEPTGEDIGRNNTGAKNSPLNSKDGWNNNSMIGLDTTGRYEGRFPANTILTYDENDFDEVCGGFPNTKSQKTNSKLLDIRGNNYNNANKNLDIAYERGYTDSGSASRYFYCAKASKKDRDEGLDEFNQEKVNDGRNTPIDNAFQRGETLRKNTHPTVKPTELMQYLVRLVTPDNGIILDPFNGSGSTGKAVMYENKEKNKNYKYIGIELTEEYLPIAKARIEYAMGVELNKEKIQEKAKEEGQTTIFDFIGE